MSWAPSTRMICRSAGKRLLDDISGAIQYRTFSQVHRQSFPRIKPSSRATSYLRVADLDVSEGGKGDKEADEVVADLHDVVHLANGKGDNVEWGAPEVLVAKNIDGGPTTSLDESENSLKSKKLSSRSKEEPSIPWYLQSSHAITKPAPPEHLFERQRIPETPDDAPPILRDILEYVSTDLGVDYLSLLDLRSLDPPAALGSNLIMVIGTARGEKHLHVSADRLCRWFRSNHKLHPKADGLLGRNELKIKLRRKNKRLKVLAHVGSIDSPGVDDGLQTGWVCVNVSGVNSGQVPQTKSDSTEHGFVGFGESSADTTIILHLLTEGKREELDLETLWNNRVKRRMILAKEEGVNWGSFMHDVKKKEGELIG